MEAGRVVRRFTLAGAYYHSRLSGKLIFECHIYKSNVRSVFFVTLKLGKQIQREEVVSMGLRVKNNPSNYIGTEGNKCGDCMEGKNH